LPGPNPDGQMLRVFGCNGANISWNARRNNTWLSLNQTQYPNKLEVSVDVSGISSGGIYRDTITISAPGAADLQIPVMLNATDAPMPTENLEARRVDDTIILDWAANDADDLAGYKVYYDDSSQPLYDGSGAAEGNSGEVYVTAGETAQLTFTDLSEVAPLYVSVTAFDYEGNESGYSNVVIPNAVSINNGGESTTDRIVYLYLTYSDDITHMSISKNGTRWTRWRNVKPVKRTRLKRGAGEKDIYVKFKSNNKIYEPVKDTIVLE
jgi:hypothetical protein